MDPILDHLPSDSCREIHTVCDWRCISWREYTVQQREQVGENVSPDWRHAKGENKGIFIVGMEENWETNCAGNLEVAVEAKKGVENIEDEEGGECEDDHDRQVVIS